MAERIVFCINNPVFTVSVVEDIEIAVAPAAQYIIASTAIQNIDGFCAQNDIIAVERMARRISHVDKVPSRAISKYDFRDFGIVREVTAEDARPATLKLIANG